MGVSYLVELVVFGLVSGKKILNFSPLNPLIRERKTLRETKSMGGRLRGDRRDRVFQNWNKILPVSPPIHRPPPLETKINPLIMVMHVPDDGCAGFRWWCRFLMMVVVKCSLTKEKDHLKVIVGLLTLTKVFLIIKNR